MRFVDHQPTSGLNHGSDSSKHINRILKVMHDTNHNYHVKTLEWLKIVNIDSFEASTFPTIGGLSEVDQFFSMVNTTKIRIISFQICRSVTSTAAYLKYTGVLTAFHTFQSSQKAMHAGQS